MVCWDELATLVEENGYDVEVNWDEGFFICPHCGDPIFEDDYPEIEGYICPICCEKI